MVREITTRNVAEKLQVPTSSKTFLFVNTLLLKQDSYHLHRQPCLHPTGASPERTLHGTSSFIDLTDKFARLEMPSFVINLFGNCMCPLSFTASLISLVDFTGSVMSTLDDCSIAFAFSIKLLFGSMGGTPSATGSCASLGESGPSRNCVLSTLNSASFV